MPRYSCAVQLELIFEVNAEDDGEAYEKARALTLQGNYRKAQGPAEIQEIYVHEMGEVTRES